MSKLEPAAKALAPLRTTVPSLTSKLPVNVLLPPRISVPGPLVKTPWVPAIVLSISCVEPSVTVMLGVLPSPVARVSVPSVSK